MKCRTPIHSRYTRRRGNEGFNLMEILIILAIMGILMVMTVPSLLREMQRARVQQTVAQTVTLFQSVRLRAIRDNTDYQLTFDQANHEITSNAAGVGAGTSSNPIIRLSAFQMRFYPPGYPEAPADLQPALGCDPPPATITYNNVGNVTNVPLNFCITDILGNLMRVSLESSLGQPRIYKYVTANDPHGRYSSDVTGFYQETDGGQAWRWY